MWRHPHNPLCTHDLIEQMRCNSTRCWLLEDERELALANQLIRFEEVVNRVFDKAMPHFLCGYLFELAGYFSSFYEACPILNQEDEAVRNSRLKLARLTANTLEKGLALLGIPTLEKM